ncbi:MAG TPA: cation:proton antiporter [Kofleriaceae bacterium]|nr:cation:proton antiporter [Kofleriaceae bacterium]
MTSETFIATVAIVGLVIAVSTLLSGAIDRSGVPHAAVFLLLGLMLGPHGVGVLDVGLGSPILRVVATLSLVLVLFTDALGLDLAEVRRHIGLAFRVLVPGTLSTAAIAALAAWWLLGLAPPAAAVLGAALASTDPVLLRGMLRRPDLPDSARLALRLESGLNDVVLLPIALGAMSLMGSAAPAWGRLVVDVLLLGPVAGVLVGLLAVSVLAGFRRRTGIRRDYESLYSLGVAFSAFAAAEAVHGSGYLSAFAAGLTILYLDVELCDCFLEYGETTAEMALMFSFVLFGTSLLWTGLGEIDGRTALFAAIVLAIRPAVFLIALAGSGLSRGPRLMVSWFGPRGLSSLLLVALPAFAGMPGAERLLHLCGVVVIASVVVHGASLVLLARRGRIRAAMAAPAAAAPSALAPARPEPGGETITIDELRALRESGAPVVVADVRTERSARSSELAATGAVRIDPDRAVEDTRALSLPTDATIALYCA